MNKARFEAFSDGVFAFAVTLLVLGFVLPAFKDHPPPEAQVTAALLRLWPNLIAYLMSFSVIGIMWQNHHALFRLVRTVDREDFLQFAPAGRNRVHSFCDIGARLIPNDAPDDSFIRTYAHDVRNRV